MYKIDCLPGRCKLLFPASLRMQMWPKIVLAGIPAIYLWPISYFEPGALQCNSSVTGDGYRDRLRPSPLLLSVQLLSNLWASGEVCQEAGGRKRRLLTILLATRAVLTVTTSGGSCREDRWPAGLGRA